jgi:hypothetical protein
MSNTVSNGVTSRVTRVGSGRDGSGTSEPSTERRTTTDHDIVDALARNLAGCPASLLTWQELLRVRDAVDRLLDAEVNRRQAANISAHK